MWEKLEPALALTAGCLHGATADRFAGLPSGSIVHAFLMLVKVGHLFGHRLRGSSTWQCCQRLFQAG